MHRWSKLALCWNLCYFCRSLEHELPRITHWSRFLQSLWCAVEEMIHKWLWKFCRRYLLMWRWKTLKAGCMHGPSILTFLSLCTDSYQWKNIQAYTSSLGNLFFCDWYTLDFDQHFTSIHMYGNKCLGNGHDRIACIISCLRRVLAVAFYKLLWCNGQKVMDKLRAMIFSPSFRTYTSNWILS